jgi:hypothetical protein
MHETLRFNPQHQRERERKKRKEGRERERKEGQTKGGKKHVS